MATGRTCQQEAAALRLGCHTVSPNCWEAVAKLAEEEILVVVVGGGGWYQVRPG